MRTSMIRSAAVLLALSGCQAAETSQLFEVSASLSYSSCGTGALDAADSFAFEARLQREDDTLTWYDVDTGVEMSGLVVDDEVSVSTSQDFEVTETDDTTTGCSVRRRDRYTATLYGSGDYLERVEGDVVFTYSELSGFECDSLVGKSDGFDELPCEIDYAFVALPTE